MREAQVLLPAGLARIDASRSRPCTVKVCGIRTIGDALLACREGADLVGMVRAGGPRQVAVAKVRRIVARLSPVVHPVLVYVNEPLDRVIAELAATGVQHVQLHGSESIDYAARLAARAARVRILRAWPLRRVADVRALQAWLQQARRRRLQLEAVILDAAKGEPPATGAVYTAAAKACRRFGIRCWRAGVLTAGKVRAALYAGEFDGVDVARGVERSPGRKDAAKLRRFIRACRPRR